MPRTKHPYDETRAEKIERWAIDAVTQGDQSQQLALVSLLHAFSEAAGSRSDDLEPMINNAMYAAFRQTDGLFDDAIEAVVGIGEEDRAVAMRPRKHNAA